MNLFGIEDWLLVVVDDLTRAVSVHIPFALPAIHKDTRPVALNQTGSAVKNKQPIGGDVYGRVGGWKKLRMIRGQAITVALSWKLEELLIAV